MTLMQSRGIALVITLIAMAMFSALGLGLLLATSAERLTGANHQDAVHALNAADAALELAARELELVPDWNQVLAGIVQSRLVDGPPNGARAFAGMSLDLSALTNQLTCEQPSPCPDPRVQSNSGDRVWGANNPRWQPFVYGPLSRYAALPPGTADSYIIVWLGDDAREQDGNTVVDDGMGTGAGRDAVRVRAEAFAAGGSRRAVEADFARPCQEAAGVRLCGAGIRVQSWRVRTARSY
jgi:hypothetical protein